MRLFADWLEPVRIVGNYRRSHYILFWLILAAGAILRFWNLGYAGLHGDEDLVGLAVRGLLESGVPVFPSEMIYVRALPHTYIMAGSVFLFGETEWALRFPSAVVGSLSPLVAFFVGRRFLEPVANLAFVALVAFLPAFIEISQTARMYIFLVTGLLAFLALVFRWERTEKVTDLCLAAVVWFLTLLFHALAVFAAPLFLFPGLSRRSWPLLAQGGGALAIGYLLFEYTNQAISAFYPDESERGEALSGGEDPIPLEIISSLNQSLLIGIILAVGLGFLVVIFIRHQGWKKLLPAILLLAFGMVACGFLHYHIGAIALLLGVIAWFRAGETRHFRLLIVLSMVALMAAAQMTMLHMTGEFPGRELMGAMVGMPSIWPTLRFAGFSPVAAVMYLAILGVMAYRFARGRFLPIHALLFVIAVWAPLLGVGIFDPFPEMRYLLGIVPFFLLCFVAGVSYLQATTEVGLGLKSNRALHIGTWALVVAVAVNPIAVAVSASNDYRTHPDHKGAAEFVKKLDLGPNSLIIAEDSINQTWYLGVGRVDFRLRHTLDHAVLRDGQAFGWYTGTPYIPSGAELEKLLDSYGDGDVYIIGSGEPYMRRRLAGIEEVLNSNRLEIIFEGRDGRTRVWRRKQ